MKIVVVDDEAKIRDGIRMLLSRQESFCVAATFSDADSAVRFLLQNEIDVLITDIRMPRKNGLELIEEIKPYVGKAFIIILSGYGDFSYAQEAIRLGVYRYILKPTDPVLLIDILSEIREKTGIQRGLNTNNLVERAKEYIHKNYISKIRLTDMAEELFISPNYLSELFKRYEGKNINEYISDFRLTKACIYLGELGYRISDIARLVGYSDHKYFSMAFKKKYGVTPFEWRQRYSSCNKNIKNI